MKIKKIYIFLLICIIAVFIIIFKLHCKLIPTEKIYGLTVDDSWYEDISLEEIVTSLKDLKVKPTVRIVMSKDMAPGEYIEIFNKIHEVAYIMAQPVDSYEMSLYKDAESYRLRFAESYKYLGEYVDIWEIGNEINGEEWIKQDSFLVADKVMAAYEEISSKGKKTAITLYYENPEYDHDMFKWMEKYLPKEIREGVDYGFISYYEDENEGYIPEWSKIFKKLEDFFPNSKLGIGECGNISKDANDDSKIKMIKHYYSMPTYTKNYVGGYFWWNYVVDCIPNEDSEVYKAIFEMFK
jgi:hypothetical protein